MLVTLIIPPLLILVALAVRGMKGGRNDVVAALTVIVPLVALGLWGLQVGLQESLPVKIWQDDNIARLGLGVSICVALVAACIEPSPDLLATAFWSAGMLGLASISSLPLIQWAALQFSILPLFFYGRTEGTGVQHLLRRHSTAVLGSAMLACGLLLISTMDPHSASATIGMVLTLGGLGGMLGWFPFPQLAGAYEHDTGPGGVLGKRFLPLLTAGVLMFRLVERQPFVTYPASLIMLAALFSLLLCGARLMIEDRLSRRLALSSLSTFSFLLIAISLQNWEFSHSVRDWNASSNLWTGSSIFVSIFACETAGLLVLACSFRSFQASEEGDFAQTLAGAAVRRPFAGVACLAGILTLAGIPPLPGFWWKFGLLTALLLPHRLSNVTHLTEPDHQFLLLAILVLIVFAILAVAQLRFLQQILFDEPFRVREERVPARYRVATCVSSGMLLAVMFVPFMLGPLLSRSEGGRVVNSTPDPVVERNPADDEQPEPMME